MKKSEHDVQQEGRRGSDASNEEQSATDDANNQQQMDSFPQESFEFQPRERLRSRLLTSESSKPGFLKQSGVHRYLSLTLSDPNRVKPKSKVLSSLQVIRTSSLKDKLRKSAHVITDLENRFESMASSSADHQHDRGSQSKARPTNDLYSHLTSSTSSSGSSCGSEDDLVKATPDFCSEGEHQTSARVSPLLWLKQCVPSLVLSKEESRRTLSQTDEDVEVEHLLGFPPKQDSNLDNDVEEEFSSFLPRRGRRQAIFDTKSLGMEGLDLSPSTSCDESDNANASLSIDVERAKRRRRSSVDELQLVLALKEKEGRRKRELAVRPLLKRNTIADFATSKAFQGSTTSLLSAAEQNVHVFLVHSWGSL